jgi:hypothetical protein
MLIMHGSGYEATEEEVRAVKPPAFTNTWHPVSHGYLCDLAEVMADKVGLSVKRKSFGLDNVGLRMFGVYDFASVEGNDLDQVLTMSLGIRHSIDKTLSAAFCLGSRVFVCDNMAFSGERVMVKKHTGNIEDLLPGMVENAMVEFKNDFLTKDLQLFKKWKKTEVGIHQATDFIVRAAIGGSIPKNAIIEVRSIFEHPPHPEFRDPTVWALFNAFSQYAKKRDINPNDASEYSIRQFNSFKYEWPLTLAT